MSRLLEEWRPIRHYEGIYEISDWGNVVSLNYNKTKKRCLLRKKINKYGYVQVNLSMNGKCKTFLIHRLVAEAFIPIPEELQHLIGSKDLEINHKDENKTNNNVDNLEWCERKYNMNYGTRTERTSKKVYQYTLDGELVNIWKSTQECGRNGYNHRTISECCLGKRKTHKGFIWRYEED